MAKPSLIALLGLLAVAGYQNRDKIGTWLEGIKAGGTDPRSVPGTDAHVRHRKQWRRVPRQPRRQPWRPVRRRRGRVAERRHRRRALGSRRRLLRQGTRQRRPLLVESGPNRQTSPAEVEAALGSDTIDDLVQKTGLRRAELLDRLSSVLPAAVDSLTPDEPHPVGYPERFRQRVVSGRRISEA